MSLTSLYFHYVVVAEMDFQLVFNSFNDDVKAASLIASTLFELPAEFQPFTFI